MKARELILYLCCKYDGDWQRLYSAIKAKEKVLSDDVEDFARKFTSPFVTIVDNDYPESLKSCYQPPFLLFYKGNLNLIKDWKRCVTIVGSREAKSYGMEMSRQIATDVAKEGYSIVSGLARGIDAAALKGAVDLGKAVGVLGTGLGTSYPAENQALQAAIGEKGLLVTEYPEWVGVKRENFPCRNRILACLSSLTLLGGSTKSSGTLITATYAADMGREVACLPYRANEGSANNLLIKTGAALVQNAADVLELVPPIR